MARAPEDREDLLRDATAFANRAALEVALHGKKSEVFVGFRACGSASFYFDQDPVYHFNAAGELRRAFVDGRILKAEAGSLVAWTRKQEVGEVVMSRQVLADGELTQVRHAAELALASLGKCIRVNQVTLIGEVGSANGETVVDRVADFLGHSFQVNIADKPNVGC